MNFFAILKRYLPDSAKRHIKKVVSLKEPLLSVVIPVYNVEETLAACLDSVTKQSYERLQIIIVDDGSPDDSYSIAKKYVDRDKRIQIVRKKNGGLGAARNTGIAYAKGKYLTFVDSDDTVPRNAYKKLMRVIRNSGSDFIVGKMQRIDGTKKWFPNWAQHAHAVNRIGITLNDHPDILLDIFAVNKIYQIDFFKSKVDGFPVGIRYEDQKPITVAYVRAKAFDIVKIHTYNWISRSDRGSISQQKANISDLKDRLAVINDVHDFVQENASVKVYNRFLVKALGFDLWAYYDPIARQGVEYWRVVRQGVLHLMRDLDRSVLLRVDPIDRCFLHAILSDARQDFLALTTHVSAYGKDYRLYQDRTRFIAELVISDELKNPIEKELLVVSEDLLQHIAKIYEIKAKDGKLTLVGSNFVQHLPVSDEVQVDIILVSESTGKTVRPLKLDTRLDISRYERVAHRLADYTYTGFKAIFDTNELFSKGNNGKYSVKIVYKANQFHISRYVNTLHRNSQVSYGACFDKELSQCYIFKSEILKNEKKHGIVISKAPNDYLGYPAKARQQRAYIELTGFEFSKGKISVRGNYKLPNDAYSPEIVFESDIGKAAILPYRQQIKGGIFDCQFILEDSNGSRPSDKTVLKLYYHSKKGKTHKLWSFVTEDVNEKLPQEKKLRCFRLRLTRTPRAGALYLTIDPPWLDDEVSKYQQQRLQDEYQKHVASNSIVENVYLFESFSGSRVDDSPLMLSQEISRRCPNAELYWSVRDTSIKVPDGMTPLIRYSKGWYEILASAQYLFNNNNFPYFFKKAKGQIYVQTWHGTPLKKIGNDVPINNLSLAYRALMKTEAKEWDFLLAQNEFSASILPRAFGYDGPVICKGYPRNDDIFTITEERLDTIRSNLSIPKNKRILLYAPTWRDKLKNNKGGYQLKTYLDAEVMSEKAPNYVILLRGHPNTLKSNRNVEHPNLIDVRNYPHLTDLYAIADILVTDYSSVMFDFALSRKPIVFLAPDIEEYSGHTRGFYFNLEEIAPGPIVVTTDEIIPYLSDTEEGFRRYQNAYNIFVETFCYQDQGVSAKAVSDVIGIKPSMHIVDYNEGLCR